jgi:hypothetical protein
MIFISIGIITTISLSVLIIKYINNEKYYAIPESVKNLIVGHSHSECSLNDSLILNTLNISKSAEPYFYNYFKIMKIVESNKQIENVFIEFSNNSLSADKNKWIWENDYIEYNLSRYFFLMNKDEMFFLFSKNFKKCIPTLASGMRKVVGFIFSRKKNLPEKLDWGSYLVLNRNKTDSLINAINTQNFKNQKLIISDKNLEYLDKIINLCIHKKIKVYFIRSPLHNFYEGLKTEKSFLELKELKYEKIPFLDFKKFSNNNKEFGDFEHLNYNGSKRFSSFFNKLLNNGILEMDEYQSKIDSEITKENRLSNPSKID